MEALETIARNSDLDVHMRAMAVEELVERAQQDENQRASVVEMLRGLLNHAGADQAQEEAFTGDLISSVLDLRARELLPDMERAFAEERVDRQIVDEFSLYHELDLPIPPMPERRSDGLYLRLACKACGRIREHFTHFVIWDILEGGDNPRQRSPYILDHPVVCPKCGAVDQYELPSTELIKLMNLGVEQIAELISKKPMKTPPKYDQRVYILRGTAMGKPMHVLDGIDEYRNRIAAQPDHADSYTRLGNILRTIGRYPQALEAYRQAVAVNGDDPEILFPAATAEHDFGDQGVAKIWYERTIESGRGGPSTTLLGLNETVVAAVRGLEALRRGEISPWAYQVKNMQGDLLLPPRYRDMQKLEKTEKKDKRARRHGHQR